MAHYFNAVESAPPAALRRMQEEKLRTQLMYVYATSALMREKLQSVGAEPGDIRTIQDLARLPFTTKEELRQSQLDAPPFGRHVAAQRSAIVRVHASSGTTGTPSYVGVTEHDRLTWVEAVSRAYWSQGLRPTSVLAMGFGIGFFVGGIPISEAATRIGCSFIPVGTGASDRLLASIRSLGADSLTCTPSYAAYLAEYGRAKMDLDVATLGIKQVFVGAEPGGGIPEVRRRLGELWNANVSESVGNADVIPIHSAECEYRQGNHFLVPDYAILEIIDPETGVVRSLDADTLSGEMVFTHIDRQCVPLLRFRTYDQVEVDTRPCPCGRTGPRIRCIGRTDDMLIIRGANVWPSAIKDVILSMRPRTNGEVQILLEAPGPAVQPPLRLQVEADGTASELEKLREDVERVLREKLIFTSRVEVVPIGTLPRFEMKARLIRKLWLEKQ
ncbi:MAG: phenylacetate--CoA ligase family protein [Pseudomonadota bacterium]|nr:phenylacetate--CoA ligase family protein [Pseudomonadota bacterium]